jgi:hypothetical protein
MHARWPTRFRSDHACLMRVASASAARCTACGCTGRTQVFRREHAEHFGRCKDLPLPCARHLTRCYGLQPAALRTAGSMLMQCSRCYRLDCPPTFAAVQAHPSTVSQPVPIPSGVHGCGNRTDSRLGRGGAAFIPDAQWGGACLGSPSIVVFLWTVDRRLLVASVGADPPARQGGCGGIAHFTRRSGAAGRGRSSDEPAADRSWCTVGPLVGFAFGLVSPATSLMGAMAHRRV